MGQSTGIKIAFCFSVMIELLQIVLRVGTFQLSDIFYNTVGGVIGGVVYWMITLIVSVNSSKKT